MAGRLENRIAIVTGAAGGIGAASARRLAQEGAKVVLGDIDVEAAAAAAQDIPGATSLPLDLTDENSVREFAEQVAADLGRIDILHNNAAVRNAVLRGQRNDARAVRGREAQRFVARDEHITLVAHLFF